MTNVVIFSHTDQLSGAEAVLLDVANELVRHHVPVTVACPAGKLADSLPPACRHVRIPQLTLDGQHGTGRFLAAARMAARSVRAAWAVRAAVSSSRYVTVTNSALALPAAMLTATKDGLTWLVHDTLSRAEQRWLVKVAKYRLTRAVAVSSAAAAPVRALRVPTVVAVNGTRIPADSSQREPVATPVVGILALLTPWKGHRELLEAIAQVPDVHLEIAGGHFPADAAYVDELKARAAKPDLAGRVRFLGHQPPAAVLSRWDIAVSASTLPEAGPLAVLEAMAHGVPMIGTNHGGTAEYLADAGILVPPGDVHALAEAIRTMTTDRDLRARQSARARQRVADHYDLSVTLPAMVSALGITTSDRHQGPLRVLFVNENIGGHRTVHRALEKSFISDPRVAAEFMDVNGPSLLGRVLRMPIPGLARRDLDLQPLRAQLVHSTNTRRQLARRLSRGGVDVVHMYTQNCALTSVGLLADVPTVVTTDTTTALNAYRIPYRQPTRFTPWSVRVSMPIEGRVLQAATHIVANSGYAADSLTCGYHVPEHKLTILPFGVSMPPRPAPRPDRRPRIVFIGHQLERKGGLRLLKVHQAQLRDRCDLVLITTEKLSQLPGVQVISDITSGSNRLWEVLADADIMCFPSTIDQAPNAVLEASAAGLPVVAHPVAAIAEMVRDNVTGFLVPSEDDDALLAALNTLIDDPARRREMGEQARLHVERNYDMRKAADDLVTILYQAGGRSSG
ncbi:glycosyltransferase family 4 protein [Mycolicibacterium mucogenicum]|uniref:glycosyltransferase family 4 protein n=1 Tax=Mycolicibacterium mucogenicum TaxID=56689 RepID=UPI00226A1649|nr:glycosyltransferase family 4 protein [Mycolicibacterium mucogenicum]MCX8553819.1 glycosyltransferase family 4 protein [Mycolicibacterium mucogenicum]